MSSVLLAIAPCRVVILSLPRVPTLQLRVDRITRAVFHRRPLRREKKFFRRFPREAFDDRRRRENFEHIDRKRNVFLKALNRNLPVAPKRFEGRAAHNVKVVQLH